MSSAMQPPPVNPNQPEGTASPSYLDMLPPEIMTYLMHFLDAYDMILSLAPASTKLTDAIKDYLGNRRISVRAQAGKDLRALLCQIGDLNVLDARGYNSRMLVQAVRYHPGGLRELRVSWDSTDDNEPWPPWPLHATLSHYHDSLHRLEVVHGHGPKRYLSAKDALSFFLYICDTHLLSSYVELGVTGGARGILNLLSPPDRLTISRFLSHKPFETARNLSRAMRDGVEPVLTCGGNIVHGNYTLGLEAVNVAVITEPGIRGPYCMLPQTVLVF